MYQNQNILFSALIYSNEKPFKGNVQRILREVNTKLK